MGWTPNSFAIGVLVYAFFVGTGDAAYSPGHRRWFVPAPTNKNGRKEIRQTREMTRKAKKIEARQDILSPFRVITVFRGLKISVFALESGSICIICG
jgi:hypothetical protein